MAEHPKNKRTVDRKLLQEIKGWPCCVCGSTFNVDPSHIKTRGSGGPDASFNVVPKCRRCHITWGKMGPQAFCRKYPHFANRLRMMGWEFQNGKLWHPMLSGLRSNVGL